MSVTYRRVHVVSPMGIQHHDPSEDEYADEYDEYDDENGDEDWDDENDEDDEDDDSDESSVDDGGVLAVWEEWE